MLPKGRASLVSVVVVCVGAVLPSCGSKDQHRRERADGGEAGDVAGGPATREGGAGGMGAATEAGVGGMAAAGEGGHAGEGGATKGEMTDGYLSGSRLRAVVEHAGTGQRLVVWHDTLLDIDCSFAIDFEGVERCLPFTSGYLIGDDACQPAMVFQENELVPPYVRDPFYELTCGQGPRILELGESLAPGTQLTGLDECPPDSLLDAKQTAKKLGSAVVDDSLFVAASESSLEPIDGRLSAIVRRAQDGSREVTGLFDMVRQAACHRAAHTGDNDACLPDDRVDNGLSYFSDDTCTVLAGVRQVTSGQACSRDGRPQLIEAPAFAPTLFYEVGDELPQAYYGFVGSCRPIAQVDRPELRFFAPGKPVPWSDFAPLASALEGTGRLQQLVVRATNDTIVAREGYYDTQFGEPCLPRLASDGKVRCLPEATQVAQVFADDQCTKVLVPATLAPGSFMEVPVNGRAYLYTRAAQAVTAALAWELYLGECTQLLLGSEPSYVTSEFVEPTQFVEVTRDVQ